MNEPEDGTRGVRWMLQNAVLTPSVRRVFRPVVEGARFVPRAGAAVVAANHLALADGLFLPAAVERRLRFPAPRTGAEGVVRSGLRVLRRGELFGVFPEGVRSPDGRLYKGHTEVARLALRGRASVVPAAVAHTDVLPGPGKRWVATTPPVVRFGPPLDFSRYAGRDADPFVLRSITDEIMYAIMELSGQEYVDAYAAPAPE